MIAPALHLELPAATHSGDAVVQNWARLLLDVAREAFHGRLEVTTAADEAWFAAVEVGLVEEFGADHIQACLDLAFTARWA